MFLVAASKRDPASLNIADKLLRLYRFKSSSQIGEIETYTAGNVKLAFIDEEEVYAENLYEFFPEVEAIVFASRHASESLEPTLTVHVPGNLTAENPHGGRPKELAYANPQRMALALRKLVEEAPTGFKVSLEATHHGPTSLPVPVWFVEIGSSLNQWGNSEAGAAAAKAIWHSVTLEPLGVGAVGFGGSHYAPKHTKVSLKGKYVVGHIFPKYVLDVEIDVEVLRQALKKTEKFNAAVVDWKGVKGETRRRLLKALKGLGVKEIVRV
jgi:D-tyrosyl-tRNA(Tyr) deacylase